ncbi:unknown [Clostridium sp. CAG:1024]|nr:unknown [Clostridium sp. CAG:1024]
MLKEIVLSAVLSDCGERKRKCVFLRCMRPVQRNGRARRKRLLGAFECSPFLKQLQRHVVSQSDRGLLRAVRCRRLCRTAVHAQVQLLHRMRGERVSSAGLPCRIRGPINGLLHDPGSVDAHGVSAFAVDIRAARDDDCRPVLPQYLHKKAPHRFIFPDPARLVRVFLRQMHVLPAVKYRRDPAVERRGGTERLLLGLSVLI